MIQTQLTDGFGSSNRASITEEGTLQVINHGHPPKTDTLFAIPFRQRFENSGSSDMTVDGSVTEVEFSIDSIVDRDIFIRSISILIGDGGAPALNKFGALTALTNGVEIVYATKDSGDFIIHDGIKSNLEFIRIGVDTAGVGTGTDAFLADVSGGGTEKSYMPIIDLQETFGLPFGMKLRANGEDKLKFIVRDDLTGLTTFNIIAYGIQL